ncbi:MAG: hypothetical protein H8D45_01980 [Bacteroidetes bacterium]|nr:hypothetical protein [Bacteroidota bacterium]
MERKNQKDIYMDQKDIYMVFFQVNLLNGLRRASKMSEDDRICFIIGCIIGVIFGVFMTNLFSVTVFMPQNKSIRIINDYGQGYFKIEKITEKQYFQMNAELLKENEK